MDAQHTKRNLIIFSILTIGSALLSGVIEPLTTPPDAEPGAPGLGQLVWLVSPFVIMLGLRLFGGDGWSDFGLKPNFKGNGFWWAASILVFPVVIGVILLLGTMVGSLELDLTMSAAFSSMLLAAFVTAIFKNIFEEFTWRGYLAPKVYSLNLNIWLSHALVGFVWAAWHLPFMFALWPYLTPNMVWYFIPLLFAGTISQSIVYGEIRLATNSVLPAWIMHTIGNAIGNTLLFSNLLQLNPGEELWFSPGAESAASILLMLAIGAWLHQRRITIKIPGK